MQQAAWITFEEEGTKGTIEKTLSSTLSSLSSLLSSLGSGSTMEKYIAEIQASLDIEQFSAHLGDKYAALQQLQHCQDLGWSRQLLAESSSNFHTQPKHFNIEQLSFVN